MLQETLPTEFKPEGFRIRGTDHMSFSCRLKVLFHAASKQDTVRTGCQLSKENT
jgi:hypothetical protein